MFYNYGFELRVDDTLFRTSSKKEDCRKAMPVMEICPQLEENKTSQIPFTKGFVTWVNNSPPTIHNCINILQIDDWLDMQGNMQFGIKFSTTTVLMHEENRVSEYLIVSSNNIIGQVAIWISGFWHRRHCGISWRITWTLFRILMLHHSKRACKEFEIMQPAQYKCVQLMCVLSVLEIHSTHPSFPKPSSSAKDPSPSPTPSSETNGSSHQSVLAQSMANEAALMASISGLEIIHVHCKDGRKL